MALIKCTECGKTFSDKAPACPDCGCPTEIVLNASNSTEAKEKVKIASKNASATMLEEVNKAKSKARSAERQFESRNSSIQIKASRNIDLFGGNATSRVVEIQADAREACDDLYASYQTLVETLDAICRPLLNSAPSGEAIKAVCDMIKYLNDESEIESNFTASFNGSNLGNVANSKYVPSISNKMIQKFWEARYAESPYAAEESKRRREAQEQARKRREEEQARALAEKKRREEQQAIEKKRLAEERAKSKIHMDKIVTETDALLADYEKRLSKEIDRRLAQLQTEIASEISKCEEQKNNFIERHKSTGFMAFLEKKHLIEEISLLERRIELLNNPSLLSNEVNKMKELAKKALDEYRDLISQYLANRFPKHKGSDTDILESIKRTVKHIELFIESEMQSNSELKNARDYLNNAMQKIKQEDQYHYPKGKEEQRPHGADPLRPQRACQGGLCRSPRQVKRQEETEDTHLL